MFIVSLRKERVYVKGHQNIPQTQKFYRAGTAPPVLIFLDPPLVMFFLYIHIHEHHVQIEIEGKEKH